jgi:hypothetical protein
MLFLWYMVGAFLHCAWRWWGWKSNNPEQGWRAYYSGKHFAMNMKALILAVVLAFIWTQDLIWWALHQVGLEVIPQFEKTVLSSISVGFVLELLVARLVAKFWKGGD